MPARRSAENTCSRQCNGTPRRSAISTVATGPGAARCASSVNASTADRDLSDTVIIRASRFPSFPWSLAGEDDGRIGWIAGCGSHGVFLCLLAEPEEVLRLPQDP